LRNGKIDLEFSGATAKVSLDLDGSGKANSRSGSAFLDHMLAAFSKTAKIDLEISANGSSYYRAVTLGRAIGQAINDALGDHVGIHRYGCSNVPMDESLAEISLDFSGRPYLIFRGEFAGSKIGDLDTQEIKAFMESMTDGARMTLHIRFYGDNDHHKAESIFKALGLAIGEAIRKVGNGVPSTKGVI
jgi:imidazoleglycerol phosphate dehydratase HisB